MLEKRRQNESWIEGWKKGVSAGGDSLPEELCLTGASTAQGQHQQFLCIGSSLSLVICLPHSIHYLYLSEKTDSVKYPQLSFPPALFTTEVTAWLVVQLTKSTYRCSKNDVQKKD